jgi:hypothetical protein
VTPEARLLFLLLFLFAWCVLGLIPWTVTTVASRGRGALITLPLSIGAACAAGILVPVLGLRDSTGVVLSMLAALVASAIVSVVAYRVIERVNPRPEERAPQEELPRKRPAAEDAPPVDATPSVPRPPEAGSVD